MPSRQKKPNVTKPRGDQQNAQCGVKEENIGKYGMYQIQKPHGH